MMLFLASCAEAIDGNRPLLKKFFYCIFNIMQKKTIEPIKAISRLSPSLWPYILTDLTVWMTEKGLTKEFWHQNSAIFGTFAQNPLFSQAMKEKVEIQPLVEQFLISFWKRDHTQMNQEFFVSAERCFFVMTVYLKTFHSPHRIAVLELSAQPPRVQKRPPQEAEVKPAENSEEEQKEEQEAQPEPEPEVEEELPGGEFYKPFLTEILKMADPRNHGQFTATYGETFLTCLENIFKDIHMSDPVLFTPFVQWLERFVQSFSDNEQVQIQVVRVLSTALESDPKLLPTYFVQSFNRSDIFSSHFILAVSNVFAKICQKEGINLTMKDFIEKYDGAAVALSMVFLHLISGLPRCRQGAHKLMCLLCQHPEGIFEGPVEDGLIMLLTAHTSFGYILQASHFIKFASQSLPEALVNLVFNVFAHDFEKIGPEQALVLSTLSQLAPKFVHYNLSNNDLKHLVETGLRLTACSRIDDPITAPNVKELWNSIFSSLITQEKEAGCENFEKCKEVISEIFSFGASNLGTCNKNSIVAVYILVFSFEPMPEIIMEQLIPNSLGFDRHIPEDVEEFVNYISQSQLTFASTHEEIISYNVLSQILLLIRDPQYFEKYIVPHLAPITLFSVLNYSVENFSIGPFHPLLDTLIDAALFRFSSSSEIFVHNMEALRKANLAQRSVSLGPQFSVMTELAPKQMLAYDTEALRALPSLLEQTRPGFGMEYFDCVLANAFQVSQSERSAEPFLIMMAIPDMMTTTAVLRVLLYTLHALRNKRIELIDPLTDIIKMRLLSQNKNLSMPNAQITENTQVDYENELIPVIIVFILMLGFEMKPSQSVHLIKILGAIAEKVVKEKNARLVGKALKDFFEEYAGDEFVASLFERFISQLASFGDPSSEAIIQGLAGLGALFAFGSPDEDPYNWLTLLAALFDGTRHFIGERTGLPKAPVIPKMFMEQSQASEEGAEKQMASGDEDIFRRSDGIEYETIQKFMISLTRNFKESRQRLFIINWFGMILNMSGFKLIDLHKEVVALEMLSAYFEASKTVMNPGLEDNVLKTALLDELSLDGNEKGAGARVVSVLINEIKYKPSEQALNLDVIKPKFVQEKRKQIGSWKTETKDIPNPTYLPKFLLFNIGEIKAEKIIDTLWKLISSKL